jgi:hypothetical protein
MTTPAHPEAAPMLTVECPLCDAPAPFDADAGVLACDACGIALALALDDAPALPEAA